MPSDKKIGPFFATVIAADTSGNITSNHTTRVLTPLISDLAAAQNFFGDFIGDSN